MIFDFNFFKSRKEQVEQYMDKEKYVTPIEPPTEDQGPAYQVGKTLDGETTLQVGFTTLTMTDAGVETLIRILEAAIKGNKE